MRYRHDQRAFSRLVLQSPEMAAAIRARAEAVAVAARAAAPVGERDPAPGRLRDSITVDVAVEDRSGRRWVGTVAATAPYAAAVEFGTETRPPRPFLRGALHAAVDG